MQMCSHSIDGQLKRQRNTFVAAFFLVIHHQYGPLDGRKFQHRGLHNAFRLGFFQQSLRRARMLACVFITCEILNPLARVFVFGDSLAHQMQPVFATALPLILRDVEDDAIKIRRYGRGRRETPVARDKAAKKASCARSSTCAPVPVMRVSGACGRPSPDAPAPALQMLPAM